jgi:hypothetical protein
MKEIRKVTWSRRDHVTFILVLDKWMNIFILEAVNNTVLFIKII